MMSRGSLAAVALMVLVGCTPKQPLKPSAPSLTATEQKLARVLQDNGSPHPVELAKVVAKMKRPRLAAAQAIVESNGTPTARGKAGEKGTWQIIEREWGPVPKDIQGQARQYEEIMEELIKSSDGNLRKALGKYNGDRSGKYARKVLSKVEKIKL